MKYIPRHQYINRSSNAHEPIVFDKLACNYLRAVGNFPLSKTLLPPCTTHVNKLIYLIVLKRIRPLVFFGLRDTIACLVLIRKGLNLAFSSMLL